MSSAERQGAQPAFFGRKVGKGEGIHYDRIPPADELANVLKAAARPPIIRIDAPNTVLIDVDCEPAREIGSLEVEVLSNEIIVGLLAATLLQ